MKRILTILTVFAALGLSLSAQERASVDVKAKSPSGLIDPMLYGQLFEHIYFSANNGVWQELI